jgi:hypothetical protein
MVCGSTVVERLGRRKSRRVNEDDVGRGRSRQCNAHHNVEEGFGCWRGDKLSAAPRPRMSMATIYC